MLKKIMVFALIIGVVVVVVLQHCNWGFVSADIFIEAVSTWNNSSSLQSSIERLLMLVVPQACHWSIMWISMPDIHSLWITHRRRLSSIIWSPAWGWGQLYYRWCSYYSRLKWWHWSWRGGGCNVTDYFRLHLLSCHEYRLLFLVSIRMFDHTIFANETLATDFTGEGFLAGMEAHVPSQIRFVIELLRAHFTFVRLVSSMFGKMLLQRQSWKSK